MRFHYPNEEGPTEYTLVLPDGYEPVPLPGRDEWLAALRSGEFKQGRQFLSGPCGDCCLGVFCKVLGLPFEERLEEIIGKEETVREYRASLGDPLSIASMPMGTAQYPVFQGHGHFPNGVHVEYNTDVGIPNMACTLTCLNDQVRLDFNQIAELAEKIWSHAPLP